MCGLYGGIGKLHSGRMIALGSMNEERGTDSVGLAYVNQGRLEIAKVAERPCVALNTTLRKQVTEAAVSGMFIGHTRQATQGVVNSRNAHPFQVDNIAFAHNGIISNDDEFGKFEVDSESLIFGIKEKNFSKYEGAVALLWIEDGKLKAYRCGNPLYRGRFQGTLYLASNDEYLEAIGCTGIKELSEGQIYTFHDAMRITTERVKKNKPFTYVSKAYSGSLGQSYTDYVTDKKLTPGEKQANWWMTAQEKDWLEMEKEEEAKEKEFKSLILREDVKEDFRTPRDIALESEKEDCIYCGTASDELTDDGMCGECTQWMRDNGVNDNDVPPYFHAVR